MFVFIGQYLMAKSTTSTAPSVTSPTGKPKLRGKSNVFTSSVSPSEKLRDQAAKLRSKHVTKLNQAKHAIAHTKLT